ncbi:MAG TPA: bifunctional 4-hydroxy-2-oxoglutarate aldolase/2-dehydro-3-deoxy-phosphogluconate aldolase [Chitinophagaceae bacterium]|nr:bifunctional 4-hydroxy-2-oxoglutarate aldolase/2-dehydro-3-deoxy-phosphogluconate aldolase [Chitinophagaceae bacterium]
MSVLSQILKEKIVAIIRGADPGTVIEIAEALKRGGVNILEVTFNSPNALMAIAALAKKFNDEMLIGAGTVLDSQTAKAVIEHGAKFIVSPNADPETIHATKSTGVVSIPGAYTATEIVNAFSWGGDIIKIFPASSPDYIKVLQGPLSHIRMMPTGGITVRNIAAFKKAGAVAFGIGTSLVDTKQKLTTEFLRQVTENANKFIAAISMS